MKFFALLLVTVPAVSFAGVTPSMSYQCSPTVATRLDAGPSSGVITKISSLEISNSADLSFSKILLKVEGVTTLNAANGKTTPQQSTEVFQIKDLKSGTMMELSSSNQNTFEFDAVFLEFGNLDVQTAGPVPEGTFHSKVSMAFIDSNISYKKASPMTVQKVVFDCATTVKY